MVLVSHLPHESPIYWHRTEGHKYTLTDQLLWALLWNLMQLDVHFAQAHGAKQAKMPSDKMPDYPWSEMTDSSSASYGKKHLGSHTQEDVLDYLLSLEM